ncbi:hypothetical protein HDU67_003121, partial [Dinochytrium kinnereticum]
MSFENTDVDSRSPSPRLPYSVEEDYQLAIKYPRSPPLAPQIVRSLSEARGSGLPPLPRVNTHPLPSKIQLSGDRILGAKPAARHLWTSFTAYSEPESPVTASGHRRSSHDGSVSLSSPVTPGPDRDFERNVTTGFAKDMEAEDVGSDGEDEDVRMWESVWAKQRERPVLNPTRLLSSTPSYQSLRDAASVNINSLSPSPSPTPSHFSVSVSPSPSSSSVHFHPENASHALRSSSNFSTKRVSSYGGPSQRVASSSMAPWTVSPPPSSYAEHLDHHTGYAVPTNTMSLNRGRHSNRRRSSFDGSDLHMFRAQRDNGHGNGRPLSVVLAQPVSSTPSMFNVVPPYSSSSAQSQSQSHGSFLGLRFKSKRNPFLTAREGSTIDSTSETKDTGPAARPSHRLSGVFAGSNDRASSLPRSLGRTGHASPRKS